MKTLTVEQRQLINRSVIGSVPRLLLKTLTLSSGPIVMLSLFPVIRTLYVYVFWFFLSSAVVLTLAASFPLACFPHIPRDEVWTPMRACIGLLFNAAVISITYLILQ